jgi:type IV pilus assembly protein PilW
MEKKTLARNKGFSLVELLIALVMGSLLVAASYRTLIGQHKTYTVQDEVAEAQQTVRAAMDTIVRYVRIAGYDPLGTGNFGFQSAATNSRSTGPHSIAFTADHYIENGTVDNDDREQIGFRLNNSTLEKYTTGAAHWEPAADNIEDLSFLYTLDDGTTTGSPADPTRIRMVKITITARTSVPDRQLSGDGYRRRQLESFVSVRNLGL